MYTLSYIFSIVTLIQVFSCEFIIKKTLQKIGRPRAVLLPVAKHNGHWSKGQGQEQGEEKG